MFKGYNLNFQMGDKNMTGKEKCKFLREIRAGIAEENDIQLVVEECPFKGECKGTCPKCEAELAYLEEELKKRKRKGMVIKISIAAAAAAGITLGGIAVRDMLIDMLNDQTGAVPALGYYMAVDWDNSGVVEDKENKASDNLDEMMKRQDIDVVDDSVYSEM